VIDCPALAHADAGFSYVVGARSVVRLQFMLPSDDVPGRELATLAARRVATGPDVARVEHHRCDWRNRKPMLAWRRAHRMNALVPSARLPDARTVKTRASRDRERRDSHHTPRRVAERSAAGGGATERRGLACIAAARPRRFTASMRASRCEAADRASMRSQPIGIVDESTMKTSDAHSSFSP
jgi:hypothetical protein